MSFFIKEALRALRRNAAPSLAAAVTVLITTLVLGVFIPVVQSATGKTNEIRNKIQLEAEIRDGTSQVKVVKVQREIEAMPDIKSVQYHTKTENLAALRKKLKDPSITKLVPGNPIPATFSIQLDDPGQVQAVSARLQPLQAGKRRPFDSAITRINNKEDAAHKILSATSTIKILLGVLTIILIVASLLLVANTIRLSIFARRKEVEVMKLVGATNWFIRWPFVIEGMIVGLIGGVGAILLLYIAKKTVVDPLSNSFSLIAAPNTINFPLLALLLLLASVVVSAAGGGLTLRRFLRV